MDCERVSGPYNLLDWIKKNDLIDPIDPFQDPKLHFF